MLSLLPVLILMAPPPTAGATIRKLAHDMQHARLSVAVMERKARNEPTHSLRLLVGGDEGPWSLQAEYGVGEKKPDAAPAVHPDSTMRFVLVPRHSYDGSPNITVEVCAGAECGMRRWPWACSDGACWLVGSAADLLGEEAGERLLTFTVRAELLDYEQEWQFAAAPSS